MAAHSRCCWLGGKRAASAGKLSSLCSVAGKVSTPVSRDVDVYYLICVAVVFSFTEKIMEGSTGDRDQHIDNSPQDRASTSSSSGHKTSAKSSRAPQKNPQNLTNMPDKKYCWACGEKTMPGKLVCIDCFYCFPMEEENQQQDLPTLIKEIVQQSLEERTAASLPDNRSIGGGASITDTLPSLEEVEVEEEFSIGFDFALVDPFIRSVREAIQQVWIHGFGSFAHIMLC
ncbi:uncharacterized protein [Hyperolius riggenbachi]|uniref:uncharacterized protein n=1 Tax=Hyperolius riggenbachi TaxID=752182 RepID=UPI0035A27267